MSDLPESRPARPRTARPSRRTVLWVVLALVVLVIAAVAWVGVRGALAVRDLQSAVGLVSTTRSQIAAGDTAAAKKTVSALQDDATSAHGLTSDPVWRVAEYVPLAGPNLRAVRQVASVVADVSDNAVRPAAGVLNDVDVAQFKPVDGKLDLRPLIAARPAVDTAARTLDRARRDARGIDTTKTVSDVEDAVDKLVSTLTSASHQVDTVDRVIDVAPAMLGADGPREYLLLFQNNAELRAGGGIPGAVALVHAENGALELRQQSSGSAIGHFDQPVLPLTTDTRGLYGEITGEYMQDVTLTPRFDTSAQLAREMWKQKYGQEVDGVLSLDPVTLGYILKATGPVTLPTGDVLSSDNAASLLLSDVYARYPNPVAQDAFFAGAAATVFDKVASGSFDPKQLVAGLAQGAGEGRVKLWSAKASEQTTIAPTAVSGTLPASSASSQRFGAYLNDATGAKMDYYLRETLAVGRAQCRADGRPTWVVEVTLKNDAPADAATSLPSYVTGAGAFGVEPGKVQTNVAVYAPVTAVYVAATENGQPGAVQPARDGKYPVVQFKTLLSPGESTTWRVEFLGPRSATKAPVEVGGTATSRPRSTNSVAIRCEAT